ncbi:cha1p [Saccharomyces arboricola H-6]|uniref:L-serine ammonia-lyase n=1 Tax=Saccharomyces arboricola (strain H-6 / AS 2.3317 / CBS 10644) TaxID=1160507 RepID=J8QAE0_SACAR|nr:cha1p [Saccharomyces arboricola H-6]
MSIVYNKTPLLRQFFPNKSFAQFFLKYECLQPSGSFKSRGIGNLILKNAIRIQKDGKRSPQVFASSGGNAGFAAATACQRLSLPCTVVVPIATKERMVEKIRNTGALVIVNGAYWKEADTFLKTNVLNKINSQVVEPIYVHPFDNPDIWEGHSSMVDEIFQDLKSQRISMNKVKGIVCSVGGGGLYNGIIQGLERYNLADKIPIVGVETNGCHVFNTSLRMGQPVQFRKITSVATSLGTAVISNQTFEYARKYNTKSIVIEDKDVIETCLKYTHQFNMVVEPACGAALHLGYHTEILEEALGTKLAADDIVIIIACGGSSNTVQDLEETLANMKKQNSPVIEMTDNFIFPERTATILKTA